VHEVSKSVSKINDVMYINTRHAVNTQKLYAGSFFYG
jgi:hypothetical protein